MKQRTEAGPFVRQVLIIDSDLADGASMGGRRVQTLAEELGRRGIQVSETLSCEDGLAAADASVHCILLNWTQGRNDGIAHKKATELLRAVRKRNAKLPVFLMASRKLAGTVGVEVATLADEFIWIHDDTAPFIAGRVQAAIERYLESLLPPYAAALARYDRELSLIHISEP